MKKSILSRLFAVVIAVCLMATIVPIGLFASGEVIPGVSNKYTTIDVREGLLHSRTLSAGQNLYNGSYFKLSSPLNTTDMNVVEMDVYVSVKPDRNIKFWISDNREASTTRKSFAISYQDLEPGWNHVAVDVTSLNMKGYNFAFPFIEGAIFNNGGTVKIANLATTKDVPPVNNKYTTIDIREGVLHSRTLSAGQNLYNGSSFKLSSPLNTTGMNHVEMDVYVSVLPDRAIKFWISNDREASTTRKSFDIPVADLVAGQWAHVAIDVTSLNMQGYNFAYPFLERAIFPNGGTIKIANLATTKDVPPVNNKYTTIDIREGILHSRTLTAGQNLYNGSFFKLSSPLETKGMQFVEMDVFVSAKPDRSIRFWIAENREASPTTGDNPRKSFEIPTTDFVIGEWNHVTVEVTNLNMQGYNFAYPFLERAIFPNGGTIKIANLSTTRDFPDANNTYTTIDIREGVLHTRTVDSGENLYPNSFFKLSTPLNTEDMEFVEMDVYVSDKLDNNIKFWISDNRESSSTRKAFLIKNTDLVAGQWNHITVDIRDLGLSEDYNFAFPFLEGAAFANGGTIKIANLSTTMEAPHVNNKYYVVDLRKGIVHKGTLAANADLSNSFAFKLSKALKTKGMEFVEMDIFLSKKPENDIKFWISSNGKNAKDKKSFTISKDELNEGWNHVTVNVADLDMQGYNFAYPYLEGKIFSEDGIVKVANLATTTDVPNVKNEHYTIDVEAGLSILNNLTAGQDLADVSAFKLSKTLKTEKMQYVEMDIYLSVKPDNDIKFWVSNNGKDGTDKKSFTISKNDLDTGWNHVAVNVEDLNLIGYDFSYPYLEGAIFNNGGLIKVANVSTSKDCPDAKSVYTLIDVREGLLHSRTLTANQNLYSGSSFKLSTPLDTNGMMYVEMDIYVSVKPTSNIKFWISDNRESSTTRKSFIINASSLKADQWNHVAINVSSLNMDGYNFAYPFLEGKIFANGGTIKVANLITAKLDLPELTCDNEIIDTFDETTQAHSGTFNSSSYLSVKGTTSSIDASEGQLIEFDLFVPDSEKFHETFSIDAQGRAKSKQIVFGVSMDTSYNNSARYIRWNDWCWQVEKDGWNHIQLSVTYPTQSSQRMDVLANINSWSLFTSSVKTDDGFIGDEYVVCNVAAVKMKLPGLPENVLERVGSTSKGATFGNYIHYVQDRIYEEKIEPVNIADASAVEFDIYITGYDQLLYAQSVTTRKEKIALALSSTYKSLWETQDKLRLYFSSQVDITEQIKGDGWNHIKVGLSDFEVLRNGVDFSRVTAWMLTFTGASNVHPSENAASGVYAHVANVVGTGFRSNIKPDKDKAENIDKDAVYISSCENYTDDYGAWNSGEINNVNKTEGKGSMRLDISYATVITDAQFIYIFDDTVDMTDLKTLCFDLLTDFPQFTSKKGNKAQVLLSTDKTGKDDYYSWDINLKSLKEGWNSMEFDIAKVNKVGNADMSSVKAVIIKYTNLNLSAEDFDKFSISIDNLRYLSSTGNTKLKINSFDYSEDTDGYDDNPIEEEYTGGDEAVGDVTDEEIATTPENTAPVNPQDIVRHTTNNVIIMDWLVFSIIVGGAFVVLAGAFIVFAIIYSKKRKKH